MQGTAKAAMLQQQLLSLSACDHILQPLVRDGASGKKRRLAAWLRGALTCHDKEVVIVEGWSRASHPQSGAASEDWPEEGVCLVEPGCARMR